MPREDVLNGSSTGYAADLAQVLDGTAPAEYGKPEVFFANTHPTKGLKALLANICMRLNGVGGEAASILNRFAAVVRSRTKANGALTMLVVLRCLQCSFGKS